MEGQWKFLGGGRYQKPKFLKEKYGAKLEIPEGWGDSNQKTFRGRGMDIFWNYTMLYINFVAMCVYLLYNNKY